MTLIEALKVFDLDENFTDENLVAVYKKMAAKYHPDRFADGSSEEIKEAEESFKKINDAFECLKSNSITAMKKKVMANLNFFVVDDSILNNSELAFFYDKYKKDINEMIAEYQEKLNHIVSASQAASILKEVKNKVREFYNGFRNDILEYWHLDLSLQYVDFFYECSLKEFMQQVIDLKDKEKSRIETAIRNEARQYELWTQYDFLKRRIDEVVEKIALKAGNLEASEQELIEEMNSKVRMIFDFNASMLRAFQEIEDCLNSKFGEDAIIRIINKDIDVSSEIKKAVCSFNNCKRHYESRAIFYEGIEIMKEVEAILVNRLESDDKVDGKTQIREIFNILQVRKNAVLQNGNHILNSGDTSGANLIFQRFLDFYNGVIEGQIQIDNMGLLRDLTFEDFLEDNNLLDRLVVHKIGKSNKLYINMQDKMVYSIKNVNADNVVLIGYVLEQVHETEVPKQFFEEHFVSLDDFLEDAEFVGERNVGFRYDALFKLGTCILICDEARPEKYSIISVTDYFSFGAVKLDDSFNNKETVRKEMMEIYGSLLGHEDKYART